MKKTIELFSGTKSFSKIMQAHGYSTLTVDNDTALNPDIVSDVLNLYGGYFNEYQNPDILWASPPCQGFSVAAIGRNWNHDNTPKTDSARLAMKLAQKTIELIDDIKPR